MKYLFNKINKSFPSPDNTTKSIKLAIKTEIFQKALVSTDDIEIAQIAGSSGAKVPLLLESKLSNDFATTIERFLKQFRK